MSTIPTTFKNTKVPYTVVCGQKTNTAGEIGFTLLLLNRGGRPFKSSVLSDLERLNFDEIISIEGPHMSHDVEGLSRQFPRIRFLILHEDVTNRKSVV